MVTSNERELFKLCMGFVEELGDSFPIRPVVILEDSGALLRFNYSRLYISPEGEYTYYSDGSSPAETLSKNEAVTRVKTDHF